MSRKPDGADDGRRSTDASKLVREMANEIERHVPRPPPNQDGHADRTIGDLVAHELYDFTNAGWRDYDYDRVVKIVNDIVDRRRPDPLTRAAPAR